MRSGWKSIAGSKGGARVSEDEGSRTKEGRLSVHEPDWTDFNDHDPGVTLVTVFAFLAAGLLWRSSGWRRAPGSGLFGVLGVGLGVVSAAAWLLRRRRRRRPWEQEPDS